MIAVRIELWPFGNESRAKEIGRMYIANDGAGSAERGDYKVAVCRRGTTAVPREVFSDADALVDAALGKAPPKATRAGEVKDYPRLAYNVWRLIARAVLSAFPEERAPSKVTSVLDSEVILGLQLIRSGTGAVSASASEFRAIQAAHAWLDASDESEAA